MTDWQPIETAPKDGTRVLAYSPEQGAQFTVWGRDPGSKHLLSGTAAMGNPLWASHHDPFSPLLGTDPMVASPGAPEMKLAGKYSILVTGDISKLGVGYDHSIVGYLFQRLLTGETAAMENLANLGITVRLVGDDEDAKDA